MNALPATAWLLILVVAGLAVLMMCLALAVSLRTERMIQDVKTRTRELREAADRRRRRSDVDESDVIIVDEIIDDPPREASQPRLAA